MHLLYLDDSGSAANVKEEYLVLGGVSVYETQPYWISQKLDELAADLSAVDIEFHASATFARKFPPWDDLNHNEARGVIKSVLNVLANEANEAVRAFACAVHKQSYPTKDPMEVAFEDLCSRFDQYLKRRYQSSGDRQRGLVIIDKSAYETTIQAMAVRFRTLGTQWGVVRNLADIPLFVDSKASRMIQLADHVAYAVFRRYQASDTQYIDRIASKFDSEDGIIHGLAHLERGNSNCSCLACVSRRMAKQRV